MFGVLRISSGLVALSVLSGLALSFVHEVHYASAQERDIAPRFDPAPRYVVVPTQADSVRPAVAETVAPLSVPIEALNFVSPSLDVPRGDLAVARSPRPLARPDTVAVATNTVVRTQPAPTSTTRTIRRVRVQEPRFEPAGVRRQMQQPQPRVSAPQRQRNTFPQFLIGVYR